MNPIITAKLGNIRPTDHDNIEVQLQGEWGWKHYPEVPEHEHHLITNARWRNPYEQFEAGSEKDVQEEE